MEAIDPITKEASLGVVVAVGALVSLVASPIAGAFSDRTSSRLGRRRSWVLWPTVAAVAVLVLMGGLTTIGGLVLGWALGQLTLNASYAAVTAMLPDQVPIAQRGTVGAVVGAAQPLGVIVGSLIATMVPGDNTAPTGQNARYVVVGVVVALTAVLFVARMRDPQLARERVPALQLGPFVRGFWIDPRRHPDFAWVFVTRFLVILGTAFVTTYLLYFTRDVLGRSPEEAGDTVAAILQFYILALLVFALIAGPISDRVGRVKPFVIGASLLCAAAIVVLAFARTQGMATLAAALMGAGFGAYTAVDLALISRVLPSAGDRARDLGIINIANALPQVLAPLIASIWITVLKSTSYEVAYQSLYLFA
ncbi:MAG: MFS transporter, partial [Actinomycetes bacterium]|nr:MFS transporter [Actinomycetes bacterium]MDX5381188.1 MFS transporter [Actinomycetes bacterium]MDX5400480.1 MFS transporter [Actinomycetes bacterium]MDX5450955.1 MFS transporter [Actinomycetes bacterium]